ncbi:COX4-domain-containing protein [Cryphonectria parasitica EP155]|uniref:Cytochrome c oxidase polypeptide V n=1 Tax=Cryphonectria parasitica (strain ATCC 38755 / EP155) TaxID=660469 RepID=A0A9P4Y3G8_CRYP1|nr:COX4-domain-containing protein [Cryphonectria parasitica EP155]KAF3765946.1 COX4-domain-containing protein [Cryphonectria parasitica EP155]
MMRLSTSGAVRAALTSATRQATTTTLISRAAASTAASSHAISNPTLANIEKRWEGMPLQEQAELWMALRDRMKEDWNALTLQEKKAAYWIAFGPHGPRALPPPDEGKKVALGVFIGVLASLAIFSASRLFAKPAPHTMNKEWQEAANEYLKEQKSDPFTGIASPDYKGKGQVQSPPSNA